jgi:hypothetical protein
MSLCGSHHEGYIVATRFPNCAPRTALQPAALPSFLPQSFLTRKTLRRVEVKLLNEFVDN